MYNDHLERKLVQTIQEYVIDEDTLWQYPIESNPSNIASPRRGSRLRFGSSVDQLLSPYIIGLTLRNVQVARAPKYDDYPQNLRSLSLINCKVYRHFLIEWLGLMDDLESLQFFSPEDWMTLQETHRRFQKLAISVYEIYYESLALLSGMTIHQHYERIGPLVASLYINGLEQKDLNELIPFLPTYKGNAREHRFRGNQRYHSQKLKETFLVVPKLQEF